MRKDSELTTSKFYDWAATLSRQTGTNGEMCLIVGGKGIGKTFGCRLKQLDIAVSKQLRFVEIFRTKTERDNTYAGYFDKLQQEGYYSDYIFKTDKHAGYIAPYVDDEKQADWVQICYFVALSDFQAEKKRTFSRVSNVILDEFIIDSRDRYHKYLPDEYVLLANLLDTIFREQPAAGARHRVYLLANACNLVNPYFQALGIDDIPEYGYHWYNDKHCLLHYVPPMDADARRTGTFVGRMLSGMKESEMIFDNAFAVGYRGDLADKTSNAKYMYTLVYNDVKLAVWYDIKGGKIYINTFTPKGSRQYYKLTKKDGGVDRQAVRKADAVLEFVKAAYYAGALKYDNAVTRELFFGILQYLGVN